VRSSFPLRNVSQYTLKAIANISVVSRPLLRRFWLRTTSPDEFCCCQWLSIHVMSQGMDVADASLLSGIAIMSRRWLPYQLPMQYLGTFSRCSFNKAKCSVEALCTIFVKLSCNRLVLLESASTRESFRLCSLVRSPARSMCIVCFVNVVEYHNCCILSM